MKRDLPGKKLKVNWQTPISIEMVNTQTKIRNKLVKAWRESIIIPTYEVGEPEKHPIFLEKRVYQGSSGAVYPHPVIEKISDEKTDKEWEAVFIENDYLKIMVLPSLGGRIQMAYDKIRQRHFVYYNHVIKPALVGLTGPWISGGIEFNWPQHHRPSTYDPVDFRIEENEDGSKTVWVSEVERIFRTKGMAGFTLHPDKAYLEIKVKLYNRTPHPQTFLWWANPAVAVNDHYQSVFPPDVNAVFDHGKRDVSTFPIATGTYYKVDYSPGTDISKYKNIPVPTSYMAITSEYDFVGGYENDTRGGLLHVADHNVSPGKKQWTWGNGDFGYAWDRNLTDKDGPYIELMCGVYTDNQPDFSWMQPYEERTFNQYFMPYAHVGVVKNASKEALVNLEVNDGKALVKVYVTANYDNAVIKLYSGDNCYLNETCNLSPASRYENEVRVGDDRKPLTIEITDNESNVLVTWCNRENPPKPIPDPARPALEPSEVESNEQLFLTGLHLEQYRHATYDPTDYYLEALKRDPGDVRCNNAMGLWFLKKGRFKQAETHFQKAIGTLTSRNPNPYDGEPYFNLGLTLKMQGNLDGAYKAFFKSCWNTAWQDAGYFNLAQIDCYRKNYQKALDLVNRSLLRNWHHHKARHLKIIILRKLNRIEEANALIRESLNLDHFSFGIMYEKYLTSEKKEMLKDLHELMRRNVHNYIEFSLDYAQAGLFDEAVSFISQCIGEDGKAYPMVYYFLGWFTRLSNDPGQASKYFELAAGSDPDYCFPNRLEEVLALEEAIRSNPDDSKAYYYLGNFWFASKQYDHALKCWEQSVKLNSRFSIAHRNLALVYYNKLNDKERALQALVKAFSLDPGDSRILMELDQLYKKTNQPIEDRWRLLEDNPDCTNSRDDLYLERITLYNICGNPEKALELIMDRQFHPWEGGEGKVPGQYLISHIQLARKALCKNHFEEALNHLQLSLSYPQNLGEGKLHGARDNDIYYWMGCAYNGLGRFEESVACWEKAADGAGIVTLPLYYNDHQPEKVLYQGLALLKLELKKEAEEIFNKLLKYGKEHMCDKFKIDYFAVSLPDLLIWDEDLNLRNRIYCQYLIGLGELGLGNFDRSIQRFNEVLDEDHYHMGAILHKSIAQQLQG